MTSEIEWQLAQEISMHTSKNKNVLLLFSEVKENLWLPLSLCVNVADVCLLTVYAAVIVFWNKTSVLWLYLQ
jgi:hypothetical protein